jgi:hypothetical protein
MELAQSSAVSLPSGERNPTGLTEPRQKSCDGPYCEAERPRSLYRKIETRPCSGNPMSSKEVPGVNHEITDIPLVVDADVREPGRAQNPSERRRGEVKEMGWNLECEPILPEEPKLPARGVRYRTGQKTAGS